MFAAHATPAMAVAISSSARVTTIPARRILDALALPPYRSSVCVLADHLIETKGQRGPALLYTGRPAVAFTKKPRPSPRTRPLFGKEPLRTTSPREIVGERIGD